MTASRSTLDRLRASNPVAGHPDGNLLAEAQREVSERIAAQQPQSQHHAPRNGSRITARGPRFAMAGALGAGLAATIVAVSVVGLGNPGTPAGPAVASASEVLHQTAAVARTSADYTLTGKQRVYTGVLIDGASTGTASGEWWTTRSGAALARTRTYSATAVKKLAVPMGKDDLVELSATPTDGSTQPWTYDRLRTVPTDQAGLASWIKRHARAQGADTGLYDTSGLTSLETRSLSVMSDLLAQPLAPAVLRGAVFDLMADLPGATRLGDSTDAFGRSGLLIGIPNQYDNAVQDTVLVDGRTATLLESATGVAVITAPTPLGGSHNGPTDSATLPSTVRTYVGPIVVPRKLVVPQGASVAPR